MSDATLQTELGPRLLSPPGARRLLGGGVGDAIMRRAVALGWLLVSMKLSRTRNAKSGLQRGRAHPLVRERRTFGARTYTAHAVAGRFANVFNAACAA